MNRRRRVGQAARERVRAGGKLAVGRPSATLTKWRGTKADVWRRSGGRCEVELILAVSLTLWRCTSRAVDPCHVVSRARGGDDSPDNIFAGCRAHHRQQDAPFPKGKLVPTALGGGRFSFRLLYAADKWAARGLASA